MAGPNVLRRLALGLLTSIVFAASLFWGVVAGQGAAQRIFPGVSVLGLDLGGLTRDEAVARLLALEKELRGREVEFTLDGRKWTVTLAELGFTLDAEAMADEALIAGRDGFFVRQWLERRRLARDGGSIPLRAAVDRARLAFVTEQLAGDLVRQPRDAGFRITADDRVVIVPGEGGRVIDTDRLYQDVLGSLSWTYPHPIPLPVRRVQPEHTAEDIEAMGLTGLLASYTTSFDPSLVNRSYNISVAAAAMDNLLVPPGEVVSFNAIVGPRDSTAGYREAPIIIDNQFEDGMGGGVCQVSSTLYNAVLLANLEIVERANHSLPISYVPIGRDATVVYGAVDFKFRNNTGCYVFIKQSMGRGRLTFKIFGDTARQRRVEVHSWVTETIEPKVIREEDPNLNAGEEVVKQKGLKGYKARAERWVWQNDGSVVKEPLPSSHYRPLNRIIAVGTKPAPVTITPKPGADVPATGETAPELPPLPPLNQ
ncbi:MAG: VanW family protein [Thermoanaerobacterales bacterium]|nr:VanW family protein [Thermoanaerobacterales bacterium]